MTGRSKAEADAVVGAAMAGIWRFISGAHMDGQPRTDATWTHRGTRTLGDRAVGRWSHLSRWERLGTRWSASAVAAGTAYAYTQDPAATVDCLQASGLSAASTGAAWAAYRAADGLLTWRHRHEWVWPLHVVLRRLLDLPEGTKPHTYLEVPDNFTEITGEVIRVTVPADWTGSDGGKLAVQRAVKEKLALQDVDFAWHMEGRNHYVVASQSPRPPSKTLFSDPAVRELVEAAPESAPMIGLSHRNTCVAVDLDAESPHVLVSASTGGGKSVILRAIFAQLLHYGAEGVVLDRKRHSHKWVRGVPGVLYCRDIGDIHDTLIELGEEGDRRNRLVDDWEGEGEPPVGPRKAILLEEVNATVGKLRSYWTKIRDPKDPKLSPAIEALGEILFMGRAVKMHVLAVGQSITANSIGGPEMRENFATRILARYTRNAWNMLVPEVQPAPKATRHIGRAQVVIGGYAHETQVLFFTDQEARDWATQRQPVTASQGQSTRHNLGKDPMTVTGDTPAHPGAPRVVIPAQGITEGNFEKAMEAAFATPADSEVKTREKPISLREAVEGGVVSVSLSVLRQSASGNRDPEFPPNLGKAKSGAFLYDPEALRNWERNRPGNNKQDD